MYPALVIADFFLSLAEKRRTYVTGIRLQKLIFFSHGWRLAMGEHALINEEVRAWNFGPVIKSVYDAFKKYGVNTIGTFSDQHPDISISERDRQFLIQMFEVYAEFTDRQLAAMMHIDGSPWRQIYDKYNQSVPYGARISNTSIAQYYKEQLKS